MWAYILRRTLWTIPIILGVVVITFVLFDFVGGHPEVLEAGKVKSPAGLAALRHKLGLDKPAWFNAHAAAEGWRGGSGGSGGSGGAAGAPAPSFFGRLGSAAGGFFDSRFFNVLTFRFPESYQYQESVWTLFARAAPVSLAIQLPVFLIELGLQLVLALLVASWRGRWPDYLVTVLAVLGMSVPALSIYIGAQWFFGGYLRWFPVAGWSTWPYWIAFAALPVFISVIGGLGGGTRFYRTVALEEVNSDYVRTARAKGVPYRDVLLTHVLRNLLIPVVTNTVVALPGLFMGALILEDLFQIPGFGGLMVRAIFNRDTPVVMSITYVSAVAYCVMLLLTDVLYTVVDPRVSLK